MRWSCSVVALNQPYVERDHQRPAFLDDLVGNLEVLHLKTPGGVEQKHDDFGIVDRAPRVGGRQALELTPDTMGMVGKLGKILGRRGLHQIAMTPKELGELGHLDDALPIVDLNDFPPKEADDALEPGQRKSVTLLREFANIRAATATG